MEKGLPLSKLRLAILLVAIFSITAVLVTAVFMERQLPGTAQPQQFLSQLPVELKQVKTFSTNAAQLQAVLKGSIYETGSNMTVFGACLDGNGYLLPAATANFTAWFPNGTIMLQNQPMLSDGGTGEWRIHVTMGDVLGTYFTQIRCDANNDYALAYGEWQNPEWVKKIGDTYLTTLSINQTQVTLEGLIINMSGQIGNFSNQVQQNFSTLFGLINGLNMSATQGNVTDYTTKLKEIYNVQRDLAQPFWSLDGENPLYAPGSGENDLYAVDVVALDKAVVAGNNGTFATWNGTVWNVSALVNTTWLGASIFDQTNLYFWLAGRQGTGVPVEISFTAPGNAVYSINGESQKMITTAWFNATNASEFTDVKVFNKKPNNPYDKIVLLLADSAVLAKSTDGGTNWTNALTEVGAPEMTGRGRGRISNVIANNDAGATEGYRLAVVTRGGSFAYFNGTNYTVMENQNNTYIDVALVHAEDGYVVGNDNVTSTTTVWHFNGTTLTPVFRGSSAIQARGIAAVAHDDVWVTTVDPSVFYHFDGFAWTSSGSRVLAGNATVVISFFNVTTIARGLQDISLLDTTHGYAVGDNGEILKLDSINDRRFDELEELLLNATIGNNAVNINDTKILEAISNLTNITVGMNQTITNQFAQVQAKLDGLNQSLIFLQNTSNLILSNVTYTQQFLETTINPSIQNILTQLGIIQTQVNQTQQIVNRTEQKVDVLLNRSDRPKAWATQ